MNNALLQYANKDELLLINVVHKEFLSLNMCSVQF